MIASLAKVLLGWDRKTEREKYLIAYRVSGRMGRAVSLLPIPLRLLFRWFRSDKHMPGWHSYGHTYGALFRRWKYRRVRLLEIGIGGYGGSLGGRSLAREEMSRAAALGRTGLDERRLAFARQARRIAFERNLITLWKFANREASTFARERGCHAAQITATV